MNDLHVEYRSGTHRLLAPAETLERITPILLSCGITRCADVTRLDNSGIPVYCAIRPNAKVQQVSNGKGLSHDSAKVSALMEAIEVFHAEEPEPTRLREASAKSLREDGCDWIPPTDLDGYQGKYFSDDYVVSWVKGADLVSGKSVWVPASAVYFGCYPATMLTTTNGLASGNHLIEATLHAIYELVERDAGAGIVGDDGKLLLGTRARVVDLASIDDEELRDLVKSILATQSRLLLIQVESCVPVYTFWSVLMDPSSSAATTAFNLGWGTHADPHVAAARAMTEAVQSKLAMIHGAREDILAKPAYKSTLAQHDAAYRVFSELASHMTWQEAATQSGHATGDLSLDYRSIVDSLDQAGYRVLRFDLTKPDVGVPVTKVIIPGLRFNHKLH